MEKIKFENISLKYNLIETDIEFIKFSLKTIGINLIFDILILNKQASINKLKGIELLNSNQFGTLRIDYDKKSIICNYIDYYIYTKPAFVNQKTFSLDIENFIRCSIELIINFYEKNNIIENIKLDDDYEEFSLEERFPLYRDLNKINLIPYEEYYLQEVDMVKEFIPFNIKKELLLKLIQM